MDAAVAHYYKQFREHGYTAEQAYQSARSFIFFRKRLAKMVKKPRRRKARKPQ